MALNIDQFFGRLGPIVKVSNDLIALQATYGGIGPKADAVLDAYDDRRDLSEGTEPSFDSLAQQMAGQVGTLKRLTDRTLADLQLDLNARDSSPATILARLNEQMIVAGKTLNASIVSAPTIAAVAGNTGDGVLVASKVDALGRDAEVSISEVVRFTCTSDRFSGSNAGGETFSVIGYPELDPTRYGPRGNGQGQPLAVMNVGSNFLANGGFDTFTVANTPDNWTLTGAVGTNIFSATTAGLYHSPAGSAIKLQGNASAATIAVSQSVLANLDPVSRYVAGCWLRIGAGSLASGSTLTVRVTDGTTHQVIWTGDPSTLTTTYVLKYAFFSTGEVLPAAMRLEVIWTGAGGVAATGQIFVDDVVLTDAYEFGGLYYGLFRGAADFVLADAFTSTTANDESGKFATYISRFYGTQLPTVADGSENISDSLAT